MRSDSKPKLIKNIKEASAQPLTPLSVKSLLADTRKLLEVTGSNQKYRTLKFYCDWVLHTKMDKKFASELLETFDRTWDDWIVRRIPMPHNFEETLGYKLGFYGFEKELGEFLGPHGIIFPWHGYRASWQPFETAYCEIVEDSWLGYSGKKALKQIDGARVHTYKLAEDPEEKNIYAPGDYLPRGIKWSFLKDEDPVFIFTITFPSAALIEREKKPVASQPPPSSAP